MTRGRRDPPKQLRREVDPIRVQPPRRCKVNYQAPTEVPSALPKERTATAETLDPPDNNRSGVSASQRQTATSRKSPLLPPSVTRITKSVTPMSQRPRKNTSRAAAEERQGARKRVALGPHTQRTGKRGKSPPSEAINASISSESPQHPPIGAEDSFPSSTAASLRKLRSSRTSEPRRMTLEQGTSKS